MAENKSRASAKLAVDVDIDLIGRVTQTQKLVKSIQKEIDNLSKNLKSSRPLPVDFTLDMATLKSRITVARKQLDAEFSQLGGSQSFAIALRKMLLESGKEIDTGSGIIKAKLKAMVAQLAKETGNSKAFSNNFFKSIEQLSGQPLTKAAASLKTLANNYSKAAGQVASASVKLEANLSKNAELVEGKVAKQLLKDKQRKDFAAQFASNTKQLALKEQIFKDVTQEGSTASAATRTKAVSAYADALQTLISRLNLAKTSSKEFGISQKEVNTKIKELQAILAQVDPKKFDLTGNLKDSVKGTTATAKALQKELLRVEELQLKIQKTRSAGASEPGPTRAAQAALASEVKALTELSHTLENINRLRKTTDNTKEIADHKYRAAMLQREVDKIGELIAADKSRSASIKNSDKDLALKSQVYKDATVPDSKASDAARAKALTAYINELQQYIAKLNLAKEGSLSFGLSQAEIDKRLKQLKATLSQIDPKKFDLTGNLKDSVQGTSIQIKSLQREIAKLDTLRANVEKAKSVSATEPGPTQAASTALKAEIKATYELIKALEHINRLRKDDSIAKEIANSRFRVEQFQRHVKDIDALLAKEKEAQKAAQKTADLQAKAAQKAADAAAKTTLQPKELTKAQTLVEKTKQARDNAVHLNETASGSDVNIRERNRVQQALLRSQEKYVDSLRSLQKAEKDAGRAIDDTTAKLKVEEAELKKVSKATTQVTSEFDYLRRKNLSLDFIKLAFNPAIASVLALIAGIKDLVGSSISLQAALVDIKAIAGATALEMAGITKAVLEVATTTSFSITDIAEAGKILVQAGVEIEDFGRTLQSTANLASSTGSTIAESAELMTTYKTVFADLAVEDIADKLRNAVNVSKLTVTGLKTIGNYLLETAESFNLSADQVLAASATLKNAGLKDSTIGTGLRQGLLELFKPDVKTLKGLQRQYALIGQNLSETTIQKMFGGFANSKDPLLALINELEKLGVGGINDTEFTRVLDVRAENTIKTLVRQKDAYLANNIAIQETGTAVKGAQVQLEALTNSWQNLVETIKVGLYTVAGPAIDGLVSLIEGLQKTLEDTGTELKLWANVLGSLLDTVKENWRKKIAEVGTNLDSLTGWIKNVAQQSAQSLLNLVPDGISEKFQALAATAISALQSITDSAAAKSLINLFDRLANTRFGKAVGALVTFDADVRTGTPSTGLSDADKKRFEADKKAAETTKSQLTDFSNTLATLSDTVATNYGPENTDKIREILNRAAKGVNAVGSQALENVAQEVADVTGRSLESIDRATLAQDAQKFNEVIAQVEETRSLFIKDYQQALSDITEGKNLPSATEIVKNFEALPQAQQQLLATNATTLEDANALMAVLSTEASRKLKTAVDALSKVNPLDAQTQALEQAKVLFENYAAGVSPEKNLAELNAIVQKLVAEGQDAVVGQISQLSGGLVSQGLIDAAASNKRNKQVQDLNKTVRELQANLKATDVAALPEAKDFEARATEQAAAIAQQNKDNAVKKGEIDKLLIEKQKKLLNIVEAVQTQAGFGLLTEQEKRNADDLILRSKEEIKGLQAKAAALAPQQVEGEEALAATQRSLLAGQQKIKAAQDRLQVLHKDKNHTAEAESALLNEIFGMEKKQLEVEKKALATSLASEVDKESLFKTQGVSPEDLIAALSGDAGAKALAASEPLANAYKALIEVVYKEKDLRDKYAVELENAQRKELDAKLKTTQDKYDKQQARSVSLENNLQTATQKLQTARENLANSYEKYASIEAEYADSLREISGKPLSKSDIQDTLAKAQESGNQDLAKQAVQETKDLFSQGRISRSEAESNILKAKDIALRDQENEINKYTQQVIAAAKETNTLSQALYESQQAEWQLKASVDTLTAQIANIDTSVKSQLDKTESQVDPASLITVTPSPPGGVFQRDEQGMPIIPPAVQTGLDSLNIDPRAASAVIVPTEGGISAPQQATTNTLQPVSFNVGGNTINTMAKPDAVAQFAAATRVQALKSGRRT